MDKRECFLFVKKMNKRTHDSYARTDTVDPVMDEQLAMFVVESHRRSHPSTRQAAAEGGGSGDAEDEPDNMAIINDKVVHGDGPMFGYICVLYFRFLFEVAG